VPRITDVCICIYVFGCRLSLFRLCDSDFGITPVDDYYQHHLYCVLLPHSAYCIGQLLVFALFFSHCFGEIVCTGDSCVYWGQLCVLGTAMCIGDSCVYWGQLCVLGTAVCTGDSCVYWGQLCVLGTAVCIGDSCVYWGQLCVLGTAMCILDSCVYQTGRLCFFICEVMSSLLAGIVLSIIMV
jgi:hypothetical protein